MKKIKKIFALLVAMVMVLGMSTMAFAAEENEPAAAATGSITVKNAAKGYEYNAYKVFDATYNGDKVSYKTPSANASLLDETLFGVSTVEDEDGNISVWALEDATEEDEGIVIYTEASDLMKVRNALVESGMTVTSAELQYVPTSYVPVEGENAEKLEKLLSAIDDLDDVTNVYTNAE